MWCSGSFVYSVSSLGVLCMRWCVVCFLSAPLCFSGVCVLRFLVYLCFSWVLVCLLMCTLWLLECLGFPCLRSVSSWFSLFEFILGFSGVFT